MKLQANACFGVPKKVKASDTDNENDNDNETETETDKEKETDVARDLLRCYQENLGTVKPAVGKQLAVWAAKVGEEAVKEAIGLAAEQGKESWAYVRGILERKEKEKEKANTPS